MYKLIIVIKILFILDYKILIKVKEVTVLNNLDEYILEIKEKIKTIPDITELELIRYVYLDLGKKISFDETFKPFGNSKTKQKIYKNHFCIFFQVPQNRSKDTFVLMYISNMMKNQYKRQVSILHFPKVYQFESYH